ncbi:SRPBCC family protein [Streptomyces sp. CFMR 7]|uniref:SRPBCC family protein n=1 Tax=Streptomyces sp. CFMR 7 TaxID=1649184 RepID=UPI00119F919A|nr:SRPBCC family protein [Streptomyces sp. CFMR 7]
MAVRHHLVDRPPAAVWSVLADGTLYGEWVVGTSDSHPERGDWPETGSSIAYHVHVGPKRFGGHTVVRRVDPPRTLELEADGGPWGTARIAFDIRPWGERTLVIVDEHPLRGLGGTLHNPLVDTLLQLRHRTMLARLAELVERVTPAGPDGQERTGVRTTG